MRRKVNCGYERTVEFRCHTEEQFAVFEAISRLKIPIEVINKVHVNALGVYEWPEDGCARRGRGDEINAEVPVVRGKAECSAGLTGVHNQHDGIRTLVHTGLEPYIFAPFRIATDAFQKIV